MEQNDTQRKPSQMRHLVGYHVVEESKEKVVAEIDFRDDLSQSMGVWHAGAIITLADTAANGVANRNMRPFYQTNLAQDNSQWQYRLVLTSYAIATKVNLWLRLYQFMLAEEQ